MKRWAGVAVVALVLTGCGGAQQDVAEAAYKACGGGADDARGTLLRLDGATVHLEVLGQDAANFSRNQIEGVPDVSNLSDEEMDAVSTAMSVIVGTNCLLRETNYPGSTDDLADGDEWDGWRYSEPDTVGSEIRLAFTATG